MKSHAPTLFFALSSEGMGHATRALPLIRALQRRGYDVAVFCGGRVAAYLREQNVIVDEIVFLPLVYQANELQVLASVWVSLRRAHLFLLEATRFLWRILRRRPIAIISDFELISSWLGWWTGTPVVAVDNMHVIVHAQLPAPATAAEARSERIARRAVRWNMPALACTLISSFYRPPLLSTVDERRVRYVPCAVRDVVLERRPRCRVDGPVVVYQTSTSNNALPGVLARAAVDAGLSFVVYGARHEGREAGGGFVTFKPFSEEGFLDDLAASPFVVVNGGHSTIVEALSLGKPVLCEPIRNHFEQQTNANGVVALGVGVAVERLDAGALVRFAAKAAAMRERIAGLSIVDNQGLAAAVERALIEVAPGAAHPPRPLEEPVPVPSLVHVMESVDS